MQLLFSRVADHTLSTSLVEFLHLQVQDLCDGVAQIWLSTPFFTACGGWLPARKGFFISDQRGMMIRT